MKHNPSTFLLQSIHITTTAARQDQTPKNSHSWITTSTIQHNEDTLSAVQLDELLLIYKRITVQVHRIHHSSYTCHNCHLDDFTATPSCTCYISIGYYLYNPCHETPNYVDLHEIPMQQQVQDPNSGSTLIPATLMPACRNRTSPPKTNAHRHIPLSSEI